MEEDRLPNTWPTIPEAQAKTNSIFGRPVNGEFTDLGRRRLEDFAETMRDEISEVSDVVLLRNKWQTFKANLPDTLDPDNEEHKKLMEQEHSLYWDYATAVCDWHVDQFVYVLSECIKWGIPVPVIYHIINDSQLSKLVDGKPLTDENGKWGKGPGYEPPEPKIKAELIKLKNLALVNNSLRTSSGTPNESNAQA